MRNKENFTETWCRVVSSSKADNLHDTSKDVQMKVATDLPVLLLLECTLTCSAFKRKSKISANVCCPTHEFAKQHLYVYKIKYFQIPVCNAYTGHEASAMFTVCAAVTCSIINVQTRTPPLPHFSTRLLA